MYTIQYNTKHNTTQHNTFGLRTPEQSILFGIFHSRTEYTLNESDFKNHVPKLSTTI